MYIKDAYEKCCEEFEKADFRTKARIIHSVYSTKPTQSIKWNGYLKLKTEFAIHRNEGEYYVYLWKHIHGDVFYVGSGKGKRCTNKDRCNEFLKHIDKGDAVVYIVADGINLHTSRFYERYISGCLSDIGQPLTNNDNNVTVTGKNAFEKWLLRNEKVLNSDLTREIESSILGKILRDEDFCCGDFLEKEQFLAECGKNYFSSGVWRTSVAY